MVERELTPGSVAPAPDITTVFCSLSDLDLHPMSISRLGWGHLHLIGGLGVVEGYSAQKMSELFPKRIENGRLPAVISKYPL